MSSSGTHTHILMLAHTYMCMHIYHILVGEFLLFDDYCFNNWIAKGRGMGAPVRELGSCWDS